MPARSPGSDPLGKRALFSVEGSIGESAIGGTGAEEEALISNTATEMETPNSTKAVGSAPGTGWLDQLRRLAGPITLECSRCREVNEVTVGDFIALSLPVPLWHPGRGFTRLMTCPACRKRAWMSASLSG